MKFTEMSASGIASGVREKNFSAVEVFKEFLSAAETDGALATVTAEAGLEQARRVDEQIARGEPAGLLAGVPVMLSDNICIRGIRTAEVSRVLDGWVPPYDAEAWSLLAAEGAVLLGKNGVEDFNSDGFINTLWRGRVLYALRPTYGLVSRYGLIANGSSLQQIGLSSSRVEDIELMIRTLARRDPKDSTNVNKSINFSKRTNTLKGKRIAAVKEFKGTSESDAMKLMTRIFQGAGAELVEISLPLAAKYSEACYNIIMASEAFTNFARYDGVRYGLTSEAAGTREMFETVRSGLGEKSRHLILAGTYLAWPEPFDEYYTAAAKARTLIAEEFYRVFENENMNIDCIIQPSSSPSANLAGLPAFFYGICGCDNDVHLVGPRWGDAELLDIGFELEKKLGAAQAAAGAGR